MTIFLLIRHAACDHVGRSLAGWTPGVHLNEGGRAQAERMAERLGSLAIDAVYSSPLERAQETAEPLARAWGRSVELRPALGELDFGELTGRSFTELEPLPAWRRFNRLRSLARAPGGELMLEAQARGVAELERIRGEHPDGACAVVSHGDLIRALVAHVAGIPLDLFHRIEISPASVSVVRIAEDWVQLVCVNDTGEPPSI